MAEHNWLDISDYNMFRHGRRVLIWVNFTDQSYGYPQIAQQKPCWETGEPGWANDDSWHPANTVSHFKPIGLPGIKGQRVSRDFTPVKSTSWARQQLSISVTAASTREGIDYAWAQCTRRAAFWKTSDGATLMAALRKKAEEAFMLKHGYEPNTVRFDDETIDRLRRGPFGQGKFQRRVTMLARATQ